MLYEVITAIFGLLGLFAGVLIGIAFLKRGYSLGRNHPAPAALGFVMPRNNFV